MRKSRGKKINSAYVPFNVFLFVLSSRKFKIVRIMVHVVVRMGFGVEETLMSFE